MTALLLLLLCAPTWAGKRDTDGDGVPNRTDLCPHQPEDVDQHQDTDGCPDPDNDLDGIPDASDACPFQAEDPDGFEDEDGCPDSHSRHQGTPREASAPDPRLVQALDGLTRATGSHSASCQAFTRGANAWLVTWGPSLPVLMGAHLHRIDTASGEDRRALTEAVKAPMRGYQDDLIGIRTTCNDDPAAVATLREVEAAVRLAWGN